MVLLTNAIQDHFYVVGPPSNPAELETNDSVNDIFNKIVTKGDADMAVRVPRCGAAL